jgi:AcrR family transcriptional regulator
MKAGPTTKAEDPRIARSKATIIEATRLLLREHGFSGVSIEAVSAQCGVAKTTIYRHWPDRNALLLDAFTFPPDANPFGPTSDLRTDLCAGLRILHDNLARGEWAPLTPAMIEAAERDLDFRRLAEQFVDQRRRPLIQRLRLGLERGELSEGTDVELLASVLVGPLFYRRLISRQSSHRDFADHIVDFVLAGAAAPSAWRSPSPI